MKSERRHELEHNLLADWLADTLAKIKPYQNAILGGVVLVAALLVVVSVWRNMAQRQTAAAWEEYFHALQMGGPLDLEEVVGRHAGSRVAHWAAVAAADQRLASGCNSLFTDKPSAMQELRKAIDLYLPVLEQSRETSLVERATFGLARAYEAQIDLEKAIPRYKEVVDRWADGPYAVVAKSRLTALDQRSVRELADKFAQWEPKPPTPDVPDFPASRPEFDLDSLPDGPVFTPKTDFGLDGAGGTAPPSAPSDGPADPSTESAPEQPAPEKSAPEKPAPEKPAAEQPAP